MFGMKNKRELGSLAKHRAYLGLPPRKGGTSPIPCNPADVFAKQVAGLVARLRFLRCRDVVVGLSGGLDSTLALLVCVAAFDRLKLDRRGVHAITMPGFGTSRRTKGNAELLAEGLGVPLETISIVPACRRHFRDIGHDGLTPDVTFENAQARMRTLILMDRANMLGGIVVGTGDMSEIALGWCTFNGDHMAMFGVNSGVPKTIVRKVCEWWAEKRGTGNGEWGTGNGERGTGDGVGEGELDAFGWAGGAGGGFACPRVGSGGRGQGDGRERVVDRADDHCRRYVIAGAGERGGIRQKGRA